MRYSIITPTLARPTLLRTCKSIDAQTNGDWEHLIIVDLPGYPPDFMSLIVPDRRRFIDSCGIRHDNGGNTCRYNVSGEARGDYILYLDDDNFYADSDVLATLKTVRAPWAMFPLLYRGKPSNPPERPDRWNVDANGMMHRREIGRFPDVPNRESDGILVEEQLIRHPFEIVVSRPLVVYEKEQLGQ